MNYSAAKLTEYPAESSSVNHSFPQQAAGYSGSRIKGCLPKKLAEGMKFSGRFFWIFSFPSGYFNKEADSGTICRLVIKRNTLAECIYFMFTL